MLGLGFPLHTLHTAYIGEYVHFRYLKCLVTFGKKVLAEWSCSYVFHAIPFGQITVTKPLVGNSPKWWF